jgi:hypothetical protein
VPDLAGRLSALVATAQPVTFSTIALAPEDVISAAPVVAAGPLAPFLAEAICAAPPNDTWAGVTGPFIAGLAGQTSVLHLSGTLEALLTCPAAVKPHGTALLDALLEHLSPTITAAPQLAATRLEAAVRLAIGNAVSPYRIWDVLDQLPLDDAPNDFVEFLPRIVGAALDTWAAETTAAGTLRRLLDLLVQHDAATVDAHYELGCDRLRSALSSTDLADVTRQLLDARRLFETCALEEARLDADILAAACEAALAFSRHDGTAVTAAAGRITQAIGQRTAWQHRTHQPGWTRVRASAEIAWQQLLLQLEAASGALGDPVWMTPWEALSSVLTAYAATRTVEPLGTDDHGLATLVKPAIEDTFLHQQHLLAILERSVRHLEQHSGAPGFDQATAQALLTRIRARESQTRSAGTHGESTTDGPGDSEPVPDPDRAHRSAPTLVRILGLQPALSLLAHIDDESAARLDGLAALADQTRYDPADPVVVPLMDRLLDRLSEHPAYTWEVRKTFPALVHQTLLFLRSRMDLTTASLLGTSIDGQRPYDYRRRPEPGQRQPLESDLQRDFHSWLSSGPLWQTAAVEPIDLALGRADVMTRFGSLRYLTEVKKDKHDASRQHIEGTYLTQTAEYGNTNVPFGQLLVLDLTPKTHTGGTQRLDELVWIATDRPAGAAVDRVVVVGVLPGNRLRPSTYSR